MSPFLHTDCILHGLLVELTSDCGVIWVDDSFDHEFGTERCGHAEVEDIEPVYLDGDLRAWALQDLRANARQPRRRKLRKWLRRVRRAVAALDPETFWTTTQLERAVDGYEEPEYDPPDREPGISSFSYD